MELHIWEARSTCIFVNTAVRKLTRTVALAPKPGQYSKHVANSISSHCHRSYHNNTNKRVWITSDDALCIEMRWLAKLIIAVLYWSKFKTSCCNIRIYMSLMKRNSKYIRLYSIKNLSTLRLQFKPCYYY